jgi:predicted small metal-binding protein
MPRHLECVVDGCDAVIEADTDDAIIEQAKSHVQEEHSDMEVDDETERQLRSEITTI